jgi:hypothetical protein
MLNVSKTKLRVNPEKSTLKQDIGTAGDASLTGISMADEAPVGGIAGEVRTEVETNQKL